MSKKKILLLEDNIDTIASLIVNLQKEYDVEYIKSIKEWKMILKEWGDDKPSLFILDDNLYDIFSLVDVAKADILTNEGDKTGTTLARHIRNSEENDFCFKYKDIPIIIYSVHSKNFCEKNLGTIKKIDIFQKSHTRKELDDVLNKCREILK